MGLWERRRIISPGEWDDAFEIVTPFSGSPPVMQWASEMDTQRQRSLLSK